MKAKNSSTAKKRFKRTGKGKIMSRKSSKNHLLTAKSKRQKNKYNKGMPVHKTNEGRVMGALPYLNYSK